MIPSHEIRWFFRQEPCPRTLLVGDEPLAAPRTDWYAWPCGDASGVKIREGRMETKLRHHAPQRWEATLADGTVISGQIERWTKWSADLPGADPPSDELLRTAGWVPVNKARALQKYAIHGEVVVPISGRAGGGVQVEWTHLSTIHREWWTIGLEAFGPADEQPLALRRVLDHICLETPLPPECTAGNSFGYPAWLNAGGHA